MTRVILEGTDREGNDDEGYFWSDFFMNRVWLRYLGSGASYVFGSSSSG